MRIHTDSLTASDIYAAAAHAGGGDYRTSPVLVDVTEHGSRKRARAFNVSLTGTSSRRTNGGNRGAGDDYAATWDEWGMFLAELFRRDPDATIPGAYDTSGDFDYKTGCRFDTLTPAEQHGGSGHRWEFTGTPGARSCKTCDAVQRF